LLCVRVCILVILEVGLGIELSDVRVVIRPLSVGVAGDCAIIVELNPLGWAIEVGADWDAEVGNMVGINCVPRWRDVKGFLVVTYLLFQSLDTLAELAVYNGSVGLSLYDCGQQSVGDGPDLNYNREPGEVPAQLLYPHLTNRGAQYEYNMQSTARLARGR
jgi:hypothetical protein